MIQKFRKKPVVVEAIKWDGSNPHEIDKFVLGEKKKLKGISEGIFITKIIIPTLEGDMTAQKGDWIIKGVKGEFYPCKPDIFEATYEEII